MVSFLFAADNLSDMLNCQLSGEKKYFWGDVPWSVIVDILVYFLAFVQEKLWLDIALSGKGLLRGFVVKHIFQPLLGSSPIMNH